MTAGRDIVTRTKISASCRGGFRVDFVSLGQWRYGVGAYFLQGISAYLQMSFVMYSGRGTGRKSRKNKEENKNVSCDEKKTAAA